MNKKRIADNKSIADILQGVQGLHLLGDLFAAHPDLRYIAPQLDLSSAKLKELTEQSNIALVPDRFNELFSTSGWISYESMDVAVMQGAIRAFEAHGLASAEQYLANSYDADCLRWGILRLSGHDEFKRRIRLIELAKDDYLAERYHACTPLLLSLIDGLANDISRHVGLFAEGANLTAWDCIAAHESGLQTLVALMTKKRSKTSDEAISIPYRHGILHGRDLAFDNRIVAAKVWAALFAVRDWAEALYMNRRTDASETEPTLAESIRSLRATQETLRRLDTWKPRSKDELVHLPSSGLSIRSPEHSPEHAAATFMANWMAGRFAPLAQALSHTYDRGKGKMAGEARKDFGKHKLTSFTVDGVKDNTPSSSEVDITATFETADRTFQSKLSVLVTYQDEKGLPVCRLEAGGDWRIRQGSFSKVIYSGEDASNKGGNHDE